MNGWFLVTGNGPFGDVSERAELRYTSNPSAKVAEALDGRTIGGLRVKSHVLRWNETPLEAVQPLLEGPDPPEAVISCGVFSEKTTLRVERVAVNIADYQFEERGRRPIDEPIVEGGPAAYLATVPIKAMVAAARQRGIPAVISNSASTHGCNSVMYSVLHTISTLGLKTRAGFIHLPDPPEHVADLARDTPSMSLTDQIAGVTACLQAVATNEVDLKLPSNEWEW